jgi:NAD(P)-dependent dehydrogenase (short-subunit alcohol dehydrogenase family)
MRVKNRAAVVTGAGRGIGRASALALAREDARVAALHANAHAARGRPGEIAEMAVALASAAAASMTGPTMSVDGGRLALNGRRPRRRRPGR